MMCYEVTPRLPAIHHAGLAALALLLSLLAVGCAPYKPGDTEAVLGLKDIVAGSSPSRLKEQTPHPSRTAVTYEIEGRRYRGDLYRSPAGSGAGIVLIPGLVPQGKDDRRLMALAYTLARLRFAVLVPDLEGLRHYRIRSSNVREVADAFRYLISRPELVPEGRAGIAGFSYGAGPVVMAALQPDIRQRVRFVMTLGGYYDLRSIVTYFTTGYYRERAGGEWRYKAPHGYAKWVFTLSNSDLLERPSDQAALNRHAHEMRNLQPGDAGLAPIGLAPDAKALYDLLTNQDPNRVPALLESLSPRMRSELHGINPAALDLSRLHARLILVHGRSDAIIPYTESVTLTRALPVGKVTLFLIDGFAHVDVQVERQDIPRLLGALQLLLNQRVTPKPGYSSPGTSP